MFLYLEDVYMIGATLLLRVLDLVVYRQARVTCGIAL